jgi:hypothetical protein
MTTQEDTALRSELARWFIDHDEVDEAARVLAPGDELALGQSDALNLVAALGRRGLRGAHDGLRVRVQEPSLSATPRRPPVRATPVPGRAASLRKSRK